MQLYLDWAWVFLPSAQDSGERESRDLRIKHWPIREEMELIPYLNLPIWNYTEPGNCIKEGRHYGRSCKAAASVRVIAELINSKGRRDFAGPIHSLWFLHFINIMERKNPLWEGVAREPFFWPIAVWDVFSAATGRSAREERDINERLRKWRTLCLIYRIADAPISK